MRVEADLVSSCATGAKADWMQNSLGIFCHEGEAFSVEVVLCCANRSIVVPWLQQYVSESLAGEIGAQHDQLTMVEALDTGIG